MTNELVFVPAPGRGHIVSEIELAKRLSSFDRGISVTVLLMKSSSLDLDSFIQELAASVSSFNVQFINLPQVDPPPSELKSSNESYFAAYIEKHKCLVKDAIINHVLSKSGTHLAGFSDSDPFSTEHNKHKLLLPSYCLPKAEENQEFPELFTLENMKTELVLVPAPSRGHIVSEIEFAKRLCEVDKGISVTVLLMNRSSLNLDSFIQELAASIDRSNIQFINLPKVDWPPPGLKSSNENYFATYMENHKPLVKDAINDRVLSKSGTRHAGLVIDLLCSSMIDVANELGVPSYVFFTPSAAFLGLMLYLPVRHSQIGTEFSISDPDSNIPTYANLVPSRVIPAFLFNKTGGYSSFLNHATRFQKAKGFIINTFAELESHAINSLTSDTESPQIYTVGPVLNHDVTGKLSESDRKIMKWLDDQPSSSVVFLCFGSYGGFEPPQLAEIANALEQSGHRFLWSVRPSPPKDFTANPKVYTNFSDVLPEGFLERTQNRGLVCGWAPQVKILGHEAVGGFVSHCGWNSILESLWNSVPIVTWPIYGEQQCNAFQLVKDLELAVELTLDYCFKNSDKIVMADEIEKAINWLMDSENPVRKRVRDFREKGRKALMDGGSSFTSFRRFIEDISANK